MNNKRNIPKPTEEEIEKYLKKWETLEKYVAQEKALNELWKTYPQNDNINEVLLKVSTLNDFYSTNIYSTYDVASKIISIIDIDERLKKGDESLVSDISSVNINGKAQNFYSFATKYCSHHYPDKFPIYESFVEKVLMNFNGKQGFKCFRKADLKDYTKFKSIICGFMDYYKLGEYTFKQIDRYLWQLGKKYFPPKNKK